MSIKISARQIVTVDDAREYIRRRLKELGDMAPYRCEVLANVPERVVARLLKAEANVFCSVENLLGILGAIGVRLVFDPVAGYTPPPPAPVGRPEFGDRPPARKSRRKPAEHADGKATKPKRAKPSPK